MARVSFGGGKGGRPAPAPVRLVGGRPPREEPRQRRWYEDPNLLLGWVRLAEALAAPKGLVARGIRAAERYQKTQAAEDLVEAERVNEEILQPLRARAQQGDPQAIEALDPMGQFAQQRRFYEGAVRPGDEGMVAIPGEPLPGGAPRSLVQPLPPLRYTTGEQPMAARQRAARGSLPPLGQTWTDWPGPPPAGAMPLATSQYVPPQGEAREVSGLPARSAPAPPQAVAPQPRAPLSSADLESLRPLQRAMTAEMMGAGGREAAEAHFGEELFPRYMAVLQRRAESGDSRAVIPEWFTAEAGQAPSPQPRAEPAPPERRTATAGYEAFMTEETRAREESEALAKEYQASRAISAVPDVFKDFGKYGGAKIASGERLDAEDFARLWQHLKLVVDRDPSYVEGLDLDPVGTQRGLMKDAMAFFKFLNMGGDPDAALKRRGLTANVEIAERRAKRMREEDERKASRGGGGGSRAQARSLFEQALNDRTEGKDSVVDIGGFRFEFPWKTNPKEAAKRFKRAVTQFRIGSKDTQSRLSNTGQRNLLQRFAGKKPKRSGLKWDSANNVVTWTEGSGEQAMKRSGNVKEALNTWNSSELKAAGVSDAAISEARKKTPKRPPRPPAALLRATSSLAPYIKKIGGLTTDSAEVVKKQLGDLKLNLTAEQAAQDVLAAEKLGAEVPQDVLNTARKIVMASGE